jgi:predicted Rossmann fold flavoprotein
MSKPHRNTGTHSPQSRARPDLAIIGAGAAGLMAGVAAAEAGLACLLIDRKHKPGRKLLMCGNARCNLTNNRPADAFLQQLDPPVDAFVEQAIRAFPPARLRSWLEQHGLRTVVRRGQRVFPATERASDVLHMFADALREADVPQLHNAPVIDITPREDGFEIQFEQFALSAERVLICTGGVSYPKTGSVGDGQRFAKMMGHTITPFRPGLAGIEVAEDWVKEFNGVKLEDCIAQLRWRDGSTSEVEGDFECARWGIGGGLVSNATRLAARRGEPLVALELNLSADLRESNGSRAETLKGLAMQHPDVPADFWKRVAASGRDALQRWRLTPQRIRPLKEAMVTVGGVSLDEVDPETMQSTLCEHLYFAGEVLDIDGPTGGYNLQMAFATAQQAVAAIAAETGCRPRVEKARSKPKGHHAARGRQDNRGNRGNRGNPWQHEKGSGQPRRRRKGKS